MPGLIKSNGLLVSQLCALGLCLLMAIWATAATEPDHISHPVGPPPVTTTFGASLDAKTIYRVEPEPSKGFHWPYFLSVPADYRRDAPLLVQPNNDGRPGAPVETHSYWASIINEQMMIDFGKPLGVISLTPAFPRPALSNPDGNLYIHALSRAAMLSDDAALVRPDLQLLAMIDDARARLSGFGLTVPTDSIFWGFSAAGDFATRMALLHPERTRAVVAGGLGGLPILPVETYDGKPLTYPVGAGDLPSIVGRSLQREALRATPMLLFHGAHDGNDSVPEGDDLWQTPFGSDSYSQQQAIWINQTLGAWALERVGPVRLIYQAFGMRDFAYRVVPNTGHETNPFEYQVASFIQCILEGQDRCANSSPHADKNR